MIVKIVIGPQLLQIPFNKLARSLLTPYSSSKSLDPDGILLKSVNISSSILALLMIILISLRTTYSYFWKVANRYVVSSISLILLKSSFQNLSWLKQSDSFISRS